MKKLLSVFMASTILLGTTNLTAFAGGGMSKPTAGAGVTNPPHTQKEIEEITRHVRFVLWSDWRCRSGPSILGTTRGHEDVHYDYDEYGEDPNMLITLLAGNSRSLCGSYQCPPVDNAVHIDTHVAGVSATFIRADFYNSDSFQESYTRKMRNLIDSLEQEEVIKIPKTDDEESYFDKACSQLQLYFNGNTAAKLEGYPAWLAKQFINKFNLRQKLKGIDISAMPNSYFLIIEEHSKSKSESSIFHIEILNGSKLFQDIVCNEALYHNLDELIYARI